MQMFVIDNDNVFGCKYNQLFISKLKWRLQADRTHSFGFLVSNTILLQQFIGFAWEHTCKMGWIYD